VLPWKLPEAITWTIAQVSCLTRRKTRRNVEDNLRVIHGGSLSKRDLRRMSRRVIMNFSRAILVFFRLPNYRWEKLSGLVDFDELREAAAALGERPSFLLASIHMGPWELGGLCLSRYGFKIHTVALDHPTPQVTQFFDQRRRSVGVINHAAGKSYTVLKEALLQGDCVALLVDRSYGATSKRFDFFGVSHKFPMGHLLLAGSTGAPIFTGALIFDGRDRFKFVHAGVHYPPSEGTQDFDKLEGLQKACLRDFEAIIREHSEQWFQFFPLEDPMEGDNAD